MEKQEEEGEYFGKKKFAYAMFIHSSKIDIITFMFYIFTW